MQELLELCEGLETVSFQPGEELIPQGGRTGSLYFLISGAVTVIRGETPIIVIDQPGAVFGDISLLLDQPHPVSVEARDATTCYISHGGLGFLEENPKIALAVARLLAGRLKGMVGYLADLKEQYADRKDQLGVVDELLLSLAYRIPKS